MGILAPLSARVRKCPFAESRRIVVLDEPEAIEAAAERLWMRLAEPARIEPEKELRHLAGVAEASLDGRTC